ncbi:MAG: hypothetical protein ACREQZ_02825 [Woeseiaceae bacterium]
MKTRHFCSIAIALLAMGSLLAGPAQARPQDVDWRHGPPAASETTPCGPVLQRKWWGPRDGYLIAGDRGPCPTDKVKKPVTWAGPRNTIPVYE